MQEENKSRTDDAILGSDLPNSDGTVSDEDVQAINNENENSAEGGQDHSTEDHEETMPEEGVGAIQDRENTMSDIAHIEE